MSIYALGWTALGLLIAWLTANWLFGINAWLFLGTVVGWLGGQLVYRFRIDMRLDGASPVAGNKRASRCGAAHPRPGHAGAVAIRHVNSQTDH